MKKKASDEDDGHHPSSALHPHNDMVEPLNSAPSSSSSSAGRLSSPSSSSANALALYDDCVHRRRPLQAPLNPPPSPRSTFISSMFGRQVLSQRATGPTICFGTADRATREKKRYGEGNPGPGAYSSTSAFGPQVLSYQKSPPSADFSRSTRDEQNKIYLSAEFDKNKYGVGSPGPTVCDDSSSLGNQITAPFKSAPRVRFGAEKRFKHMEDGSPGVGKYEIMSSFGKQNESRKKNLPAFSFCHSNRDQSAKVFISVQHDKAHYGEGSPGPAAALKAYRSLGETQVDSRKASCVASRFGRATRFKDYYSDIPGPGNYNC